MLDFPLLLLLPAILGFLAQRKVISTFREWSRVPNAAGITGEETARRVLAARGVQGVAIEQTQGKLTDHYDPKSNILRLSDAVAGERSVAAIGIAAHEAAHAIQDAEGSVMQRFRMAIGEPLARLSQWSGVIFIGAFWFGIPILMLLAGLILAGYVLFALVTLPVEIGASQEASRVLIATATATEDDIRGVRKVLRAAAGTYVAALGQRLGFFLFLVSAVMLGRA